MKHTCLNNKPSALRRITAYSPQQRASNHPWKQKKMCGFATQLVSHDVTVNETEEAILI
uniref:Uncharacterized protein n=1 Tax=Setaria italica TaxID=4555 RepID=K3YXK2_SETIT